MKLILLLLALAIPSAALAQTNGPIIIEGISGDAPPDPAKQARKAKFEKKRGELRALEKPAKKEQVLEDHAHVQESLRRTGPFVHGLQRYVRLQEDIVHHWRGAVRLQAAAHKAFRARRYHTAIFLTLRARGFAREGYEMANVTLAKEVEDTTEERDYAAKSTPEQAKPFVDAALVALPDSVLDPTKSPHLWRSKPVVD